MRAADIAEALRELPPDAAAKVHGGAAVRSRGAGVRRAGARRSTACDDHHAHDRRATSGRSSTPCRPISRRTCSASSPAATATALLKTARPSRRARRSSCCCKYPPDTAGGIMTTEFVSMPDDLDRRARRSATSREVGRAKETVYAIYVIDPDDAGARARRVAARADVAPDRAASDRRRRQPAQAADRHAARPIARKSRGSSRSTTCSPCPSSTNATRARHRHGRRRHRRDRSRADRGRAEVRRYGGARRAVHARSASGAMIRKRARLALRALPRRDADGDGDGALRGRDRARPSCWRCSFRSIISSGGNSGSQATSLIIRALALREIELARLVARRAARAAAGLDARRDPRRRSASSGSCCGSSIGSVRLRPALVARRGDRGRRARRRRDVRIARRLDAAVPAQAARLRSRERVGAVRRDAGRRDGARDLLHRRVSDSARNAAVACAFRAGCHSEPRARDERPSKGQALGGGRAVVSRESRVARSFSVLAGSAAVNSAVQRGQSR